MRLVLLLKAKKRAKIKKPLAANKPGLHKEKRRNKKGVLVTKLVRNAPAVTGKKQAKGSKVLTEEPKRKTQASDKKLKSVFESLMSWDVHYGEDVFDDPKELSAGLEEHGFKGRLSKKQARIFQRLNKKQARIFQDAYAKFYKAAEAKAKAKPKGKNPSSGGKPKPAKPKVSRTRDEDPDSPKPAKGPLNEKLIGKFLDAKNAKESMTISASGDKHYPYRVVNTSENLKEPMHVDDLTESQALNWISGMKPAKK
mgnify:CR=1 FL=1